MLADRDAGSKEPGVRRPREVGRVVDVERVDPDDRGTRFDEQIDGRRGQERVVAAVRLGSPMAVVPRVDQDRPPARS